jgi:hypothetical protein
VNIPAHQRSVHQFMMNIASDRRATRQIVRNPHQFEMENTMTKSEPSGAEPVFSDQVIVASGGGTVLLTFCSPMCKQIGERPQMAPTLAVAMTEERVRDMIATIQAHLSAAAAVPMQPGAMRN